MVRMEGTHFDGTYPHIFVTFGASVSRTIKVFVLVIKLNQIKINFNHDSAKIASRLTLIV